MIHINIDELRSSPICSSLLPLLIVSLVFVWQLALVYAWIMCVLLSSIFMASHDMRENGFVCWIFIGTRGRLFWIMEYLFVIHRSVFSLTKQIMGHSVMPFFSIIWSTNVHEFVTNAWAQRALTYKDKHMCWISSLQQIEK